MIYCPNCGNRVLTDDDFKMLDRALMRAVKLIHPGETVELRDTKTKRATMREVAKRYRARQKLKQQ